MPVQCVTTLRAFFFQAGRTPFEEAQHELERLDGLAESNSATRRARLQQTLEAFLG